MQRQANSSARRGRDGDEHGEGAGYSPKRETAHNCFNSLATVVYSLYLCTILENNKIVR
jgi:hypothetical protein